MEASKKREDLRRRIGAAPRDARGHRRYGSKLKRDVIRYVERKMGRGGSLKAVAREISLSPDTLWTWMRGEKQQPSKTRSRKRVRTVKVVSQRAKEVMGPVSGTASSGAGIVVVMPNGVRIEGLGAVDAASIVRALS